MGGKMAGISIYSTEFLDTLEKGYITNPIEMPEAEVNEKKEYVVQREVFEKVYREWDRDARPILEVRDDLTGLPIWLSQQQADKVHRGIVEGKDSVDLL